MSVVKNVWTEFSTAPGQNVNLQSGGTFTYSDLNSVYNGAGPTKGGLPLNDGDTFAWNNADVTFNSAGYYEFTYTVTSATCGSDSQEIILYLYEVDIASSTTTCDYTLSLTDPDDVNNLDVMNLSMPTNEWYTQGTFKYVVQRDCGGLPEVIYESPSSITVPNFTTAIPTFRIRYGNSSSIPGTGHTFTSGDFIEEIVIRSTAAGLITIDLSGVTPYAGNITTYMNDVQAAIESYLSTTYSYTNNTNYYLQTIKTSASNWAISFGVKNAPAGAWAGIDVANTSITINSGGGSTVYTGDNSGYIVDGGYGTFTNYPSPAYSIPCGSLSTAFAVSGISYQMSDASNIVGMSINYNSAVNVAPTSFAYTSGTTFSTCSNVPSLVMSLFPTCTTTEFYEWYDAAVGGTLIGDTDTLVPPGAGTYRAEITCDTVVCSNTITV